MSVHLQTKWLWFCVQLQWLKHHILHLLRARSFLTFRQLWSVDSLWNAYMIWQEHTVTWNYLFIHTYYYWNNKHGNAKENASCASSRIHQLSIFKIWGQKLEVLLSIFCGTKINKFFHPLPIIQYFEIFIPAICNFGRGGEGSNYVYSVVLLIYDLFVRFQIFWWSNRLVTLTSYIYIYIYI